MKSCLLTVSKAKPRSINISAALSSPLHHCGQVTHRSVSWCNDVNTLHSKKTRGAETFRIYVFWVKIVEKAKSKQEVLILCFYFQRGIDPAHVDYSLCAWAQWDHGEAKTEPGTLDMPDCLLQKWNSLNEYYSIIYANRLINIHLNVFDSYLRGFHFLRLF